MEESVETKIKHWIEGNRWNPNQKIGVKLKEADWNKHGHTRYELGDDVKAVVVNAKADDFVMDFAKDIITYAPDPLAWPVEIALGLGNLLL